MTFIKQRLKRIIVIFAVIVASLVITAVDNISITFYYADESCDGKEAVLFLDYGNGYSEADKSRAVINGNSVTFQLNEYNLIERIGFSAIRVNDSFEGLRTAETCHVTGAGIEFQGGTIRKYTEKQLISAQTDDPYALHAYNSLVMTDNFDSPYFSFRGDIVTVRNPVGKAFFFVRSLLGNILFLMIPLVLFYIARRFLQKRMPLRKYSPAITAAAIGLCPLLLYLFAGVLNNILTLVIVSAVMLIVGCYHERDPHEKNIYMLMCIGLGPYFIQRARTVISQAYDPRLNIFIGYLVMVYGIAVYSFLEWKPHTKDEIYAYKTRKLLNGEVQLDIVCSTFAKTFIIYFVFNIIKTILIDNSFSLSRALSNCLSAVGILNISWFFTVMLFVMLFVGTGISGLIFGLYGIIYMIGDFIKMYYNDTLLLPRDLQQIPDMFKIMSSTINKGKTFLVAVVLIGLVVWLLFSLKRAGRYLKPSFHILAGILSFVPVFLFTRSVLAGDFHEGYEIGYTTLLSQYESEAVNGKYFYDFFNVVNMSSNTVMMPSDYSKEHMEELKETFTAYDNYDEEADIRPNVIFIMAESFFDMDNISSLSFSEELEPNVHRYSNGNVFSSSFGGSTAAIEYEALSGHSMYFYQSGTIPYTAFVSGPFNSIVAEFNNSGYKTIAFHPNTASFYNRDKAYEMMGFSKFVSNDNMDISSKELTPGGYMKDKSFARRAIDMLEDSDEPVFLFGVSIASHYTAAEHVPGTPLTVSGKDLTESDKQVIVQQAAAFQETDEMLKTFIDYVDSCDEPTILYLFGDHLPPLPNWSKLSYTDDLYQKFGTNLIGYSNYKEITFPSYISPNYLGVSLIMDAGIPHNSYWDYLYHLRDLMPIMNRNLVGDLEGEEIENYRNIQYDLMFGQSFLLEEQG